MKTIQTIRLGILAWIAMPFSWTKWEDINTFGHVYDHYLLQGRLNKISGAKKFRVVPFKGIFPLTVNTPHVPIDRVIQIGTIHNQ